MCCWTHGVDIDEADYIEGVCSVGELEEDYEENEFEDD